MGEVIIHLQCNFLYASVHSPLSNTITDNDWNRQMSNNILWKFKWDSSLQCRFFTLSGTPTLTVKGVYFLSIFNFCMYQFPWFLCFKVDLFTALQGALATTAFKGQQELRNDSVPVRKLCACVYKWLSPQSITFKWNKKKRLAYINSVCSSLCCNFKIPVIVSTSV